MENNQNIPDEVIEEVVKTTEKHDTVGPVIGTIVIVAVLIIGGLYYWGAELNKQSVIDETLTAEDISAVVDESTEALGVQSASDEVTAIEDDLDLTDLGDLDAELDSIDAELGL